MFKSQLFITIKSLRKRKGFVLINIVGLALGIWCSIMTALWVIDEYGWNSFHINGDNIYQVMANVRGENGNIDTWQGVGYPVAEPLSQHIPGILSTVRTSTPRTSIFELNDQVFEYQTIGADSNFFQTFSFPLKEGYSEKCLYEKNSIVISEDLASSLFFGKEAIGKTILLTLDEDQIPYIITGVFKNIPEKSTLQFDAVVPLDNFLPMNNKSWGNAWTNTFVLVDPKASLTEINKNIKDIPEKWGDSKWFTIFLHPLKQIYLNSKFENGKPVGGRVEYVRLFIIIAIFTLLIACFNFINLTTSGSIKRSKEVGIKKILGAGKAPLIFQFFMESFVLVFVAMILAVIMAKSSMNFFNTITSKQLDINFYDPNFYILLFSIGLTTVMLAGIYPAIMLSSFNPVRALKGTFLKKHNQVILRKGLVVIQFCISLVLVAGVIIVYLQLQYLQHKNLGFNKENILYLPMDSESYSHSEAMLAELENTTLIKVVSRAGNDFSSEIGNTSDPQWEGRDDSKSKPWFSILDVDFNMLEMLDIQLKNGRYFSDEYSTDTLNYILNEEAVQAMGIEEPLGKSLSFWGEQGGKIVGVVKNFNYTSLHNSIQPLIIRCRPSNTSNFFVKTNTYEIDKTLSYLKKIHHRFSNLPFSYHFLDKRIENNYLEEQKFGKLGGVLALLALFISCLGLLGLATHATNQRIKEIAIRKVLGAKTMTLFRLLTMDFLKLILLSLLIAIPISWFIMYQWIQGFAYHIKIQWWVYGITVLFILLIALLTISSQSLKVSNNNTISSLRAD